MSSEDNLHHSTSFLIIQYDTIWLSELNQWRTQNFFSGGGSTNSIEDRGHREQGSGAVTPQSGVPPNLQLGETRILIRLLKSIFHGTGNSARLCQNFGIISGGFEPPKPPSGYASELNVYFLLRSLIERYTYRVPKRSKMRTWLALDYFHHCGFVIVNDNQEFGMRSLLSIVLYYRETSDHLTTPVTFF
jgi:hypothetical protein